MSVKGIVRTALLGFGLGLLLALSLAYAVGPRTAPAVSATR
jgi:hypothetical protein